MNETHPNVTKIRCKFKAISKYFSVHRSLLLENIKNSGLSVSLFKNSIRNLKRLIKNCESFQHIFGVEVFAEKLDLIFAEDGTYHRIKSKSKNFTVFKSSNGFLNLIEKLGFQLKTEYFYNSTVITAEEYSFKSSEDLVEKFDELDIYVDIGEELAKDPLMSQIKSELGALEIPDMASFFAAIIGPSFMGKTQSAFTLSHIMNVIYVNLTTKFSTSDDDQKIYKIFESIALFFFETISYDIIETQFSKKDNQPAKRFKDCKAPLRTVGLIYVLLRLRCLISDSNASGVKKWLQTIAQVNYILIPQMTIQEFRQSILGTIIINQFSFIYLI